VDTERKRRRRNDRINPSDNASKKKRKKNIQKAIYKKKEQRKETDKQTHRIEKQDSKKDNKLHEVQEPTTLMQDIFQLLIKIVIVCACFTLVFTFLFGIHRVTDNAMEPALQDGDVAIFYRLDKRYVASDTVVLEYEGKKQIRRVVAVAGDIVDVTEEGVLINGSRVQEQGIYQDTLRYTDGVTFPITVLEGQIFVLGDNRTEAIDGRLYGTVNIDDTFGKVMTILRRRNI
jgi:signal peptidase I, bacterial type